MGYYWERDIVFYVIMTENWQRISQLKIETEIPLLGLNY
jgi:hypothetical protein